MNQNGRNMDGLGEYWKCESVESLSFVWLFVTPWTATLQAPLSMEFSRPEYWSGFPFSPAKNLLNPGIEPRSPVLKAGSLLSEPSRKSYFTKWNKSDRERQVIISMWNLKTTAREYNKKADSDTENKPVVASGERKRGGAI